MAGERLTALALTGLALTASCTTKSHTEKGTLPQALPTVDVKGPPTPQDLSLIREFEVGQKAFEAQIRSKKLVEMTVLLGACAIVDGKKGLYYTVPFPAYLKVPTPKGLLEGIVAYDPLRDNFIHGQIAIQKGTGSSLAFDPIAGSPDEIDYMPSGTFQPVLSNVRFNGSRQSLTLENDALVNTVGAASASSQGSLGSYAEDQVTQLVCEHGGQPRPNHSASPSGTRA
jgi:hypothetical protein